MIIIDTDYFRRCRGGQGGKEASEWLHGEYMSQHHGCARLGAEAQ